MRVLARPFIDLPDNRLAEQDVLLAEPNRYILGFEETMQLSRGLAPVVPGMTRKQVVRLGPRSYRSTLLR